MLFGERFRTQKMVYHCRSFKSLQELKRAIVAAWQQLSQAFLGRSISEWWRHLENVVGLYSIMMVDTSNMSI